MPLPVDIFNKKILSSQSRFGTYNILLSGEADNNAYPNSNPSGFITSQNVVFATGDQIISGSKTFLANRYIFSGANVIFIDNTGISSGYWEFNNRPTVNGTGVLLSGEASTQTNLNQASGNLQSQIDILNVNSIAYAIALG